MRHVRHQGAANMLSGPGFSHSRRPHSVRRQPLLMTGVAFLAILAGAVAAQAGDKKVSFSNDVIPVLTKAGCNLGVCHAKAGGGQNGFQLSLLGFEPRDDFEELTSEFRARRLFPAAPEKSLLLQKASGQVPHGGGVRLPADSDGYAVLREWIRQGAPKDEAEDPTLVAFDIEPKDATIQRKSELQLKAIAKYSDGTTRDVTRLSPYESNEPAMAEVNDAGLVKILTIPGKVALMVRYQGKVAVFSGSVPLGAPVDHLPPSRNFIDELVFANLKQL